MSNQVSTPTLKATNVSTNSVHQLHRMGNNFLVSARKYRPRFFHEIIGQDDNVITIRNSIINKQIARAFLFCGKLGSGKTSCARILAQTLNCEQVTPLGEPCGSCASCNEKTSLNIHELDAASHNSAEDMRKIVEQIRYCPPNGKKMIIIIDEAHMLSNAALNVLLKPLEDTPPHVVFILITTEKHKIIPTVLSRCQVFDFAPIAVPKIQEQLTSIAHKENIACEKEAVLLVSQKANGSLRNALSMFDLIVTFVGGKKLTYEAALRHLNLLDNARYFSMVDAIYHADIAQALLQYDAVLKTGFNGLFFVSGLAQHLRNLLVAQTSSTLDILQVPDKDVQLYKEKAQQISADFICKALELLQACELSYKEAVLPQLHVEMCLLKLSRLGQQTVHLKKTELDFDQKKQRTIDLDPPLQKKARAYASLSQEENMFVAEAPPPPFETKKKRTLTIPSKEAIQQRIRAGENTDENKLPTEESSLREERSNDANISWEIVERYWGNYAEKIKSENAEGYKVLQCPKELKGRTILVALHQKEQEKVFKKLEQELCAFLQVSLQTKNLAVKYELHLKKPYSDYEKLNDLLGRHSSLSYLKEQLQLTT